MTDKAKIGLLISAIFAGSAATAGIVYVLTEEPTKAKKVESKDPKEGEDQKRDTGPKAAENQGSGVPEGRGAGLEDLQPPAEPAKKKRKPLPVLSAEKDVCRDKWGITSGKEFWTYTGCKADVKYKKTYDDHNEEVKKVMEENKKIDEENEKEEKEYQQKLRDYNTLMAAKNKQK